MVVTAALVPAIACGGVRIVSLAPNITELLFAAGAGAQVVGVDAASDFPPAARALPRVGDMAALDVEALLGLKPDLVVLWASGTSPRQREQLAGLGLHLMVTEEQRLEDIGAALVDLGRAAGTLPAARAAARDYAGELDRLRARYAGRPRLRVFYQVWDRPIYTVSAAQVLDEMLSLCGGDNVFAELRGLAPVVDREAVLDRDPEVIIIGAAGVDGERQVQDWRRYPALDAVRRGRIYTVDPSITSRMSPRILEGVQASVRGARPGACRAGIRREADLVTFLDEFPPLRRRCAARRLSGRPARGSGQHRLGSS